MAPVSAVDLVRAVSETIAARHFTYVHTMKQPFPDGTEMTSKEEGYVDLVAEQMDSWTHFDTGEVAKCDPDTYGSERCSASGSTRMMLDGATIYLQFPDDTWDEMPVSGVGASSVALLFWLYGTTETVPTSDTDIEVGVDFDRACRSVPDSVRGSVREGLEDFLSEGFDGIARGRVQVIDGLVRSIVLTLPSRPDPASGDRIPESEMALHLTSSPPRTLTFPQTS
ncbi:hypothetical protein ACFVWF_29525 [Rhodococcus qingshengii]|uniref:hypothetical protein n=1 Tax=Rhodococcus qingshengii TaxID=334542 RepID=UPI0036DB1FE3